MSPPAKLELLSGLPLPLVQLARRALTADSHRERHDRTMDLAEATLKLAASARIGRWVDAACEPGSDLGVDLERLMLPAPSSWCGYLHDVGEALIESGDRTFAGAERLVEGDWPAVAAFMAAAGESVAAASRRRGVIGLFEALPDYRRQSASEDDPFHERLGLLLFEALAEVLASRVLFGELQLCVPKRDSTAVTWRGLTGLSGLPLTRVSHEPAALGAVPDHLYFLGDDLIVPLHPLVVLEEDDRGERFGFLNRDAANVRILRRTEYLDYVTGKTLASVDVGAALAELLSKLRGEPSDAAAVTSVALSVVEREQADKAKALDRELAAGATLGRYEIIGTLGSGGMGHVYAARDTRLGRHVALKVLAPTVAGIAERRKRFEREARAAAVLSHANIATLYSVEDADGRPFITMELVEGEPLAKVIPDDGLPLGRLLALGVQLADAIATAHAQGFLHRDLKPQNVMVTPDGIVKVLDFGLTKRIGESEPDGADTATRTGHIIGTPLYMSPEQAEGGAVDPRSDIFSLGIVLYEMATGRRPFAGKSPVSILSAVLKDTAPNVRAIRPDLPARLDAIVRRCLAKEPERRYQSARDLVSDLEELSTESAPLGARLPARVRMLFVLLVAGAGAAGYIAGRTTRPETPDAPPAIAASTSPRPAAITSFTRLTHEYGRELGPQLSPDGTAIVFAAGEPGTLDVYRQRVGGRLRTNLTADSPGDDWQPAISPDGERIAFRSERDGGGIFVMGSTGESVRRVSSDGYHPAFAPDGKHLVVNSHMVKDPRSRGTLSKAWIVDIDSGTKQPLDGGRDAAQGSWSPDGRWLVLHGSLDLEHAGLLVAAPGEEPRLLLDRGHHVVWTPLWAPDGKHIYYSGNATGVMNIWRLPVDDAAMPVGPPEQVTSGVAVSAEYPSLSQDGRRMVFAASTQLGNLFKVRFDSVRGRIEGEPMAVTRGDNDFSAPDVSPDGASVAFCSCWVRADSDENILVARADGSEIRDLTADVGSSNRLPRWTSDGKRILFYSNRSGDWAVWSVAPDGSELRQITDTPGQVMLFAIPEHDGTRVMSWVNMEGMLEFNLAERFSLKSAHKIQAFPEAGRQFVPSSWSPDGSSVAGWLGVEGASGGLYTYVLSTGDYRKITSDGKAPRWLADGKRLIYTDDAGEGIWLVDADSQEPRRLRSFAPWRLAGHLSVSRDEQWIYFSTVTTDGDVWLASWER